MTSHSIKDHSASVKDRLTNLARQQGEEFSALLSRFAIERLLFRLASTSQSDRFVLKGATLFALWTGQPHRPTRDLDLLGWGENSIPDLEAVFRSVCQVDTEPDGLIFLPETVEGSKIKEDQEYEGVRISLLAMLGRSRIPLQIDVGFGDAVFPQPDSVEVPSLLGFPAPRLRAYPREAVVAEKFQAMVALGMGNSRMKDFYDVWVLSHSFVFHGEILRESIRRTFERRNTAIPNWPPLALTQEFSADQAKTMQWKGFLKKGRLAAGLPSLEEVIQRLADFLRPVTVAAGNNSAFPQRWLQGGPWGPFEETASTPPVSSL